MEVADIDAELLALNNGVKLDIGLPEFGTLAEGRGEELPAPVIDPIELSEAPGDAVRDCVELTDTDTELLKLFTAVNVPAEVCVVPGLSETL